MVRKKETLSTRITIGEKRLLKGLTQYRAMKVHILWVIKAVQQQQASIVQPVLCIFNILFWKTQLLLEFYIGTTLQRTRISRIPAFSEFFL